MNLVYVQVLDWYDNSTLAEHFFYTEKPKEYFCVNDYGLMTEEFINILKEKYPNDFTGSMIKKAYYYHKDKINII